jgi:hypothetical protein
MLWARMVAYVTGTVNQELLLRNEYLGAENRILSRDLWAAGRGAFHLLLQEDRNLRILLYCIKAYALVPACLFLIACQ